MTEVRLRQQQQTCLGRLVPIELAPRRVYVDLGARDFASSIGDWFLRDYPQANTFEIKAWELSKAFNATYIGHPEVELHNEAVWINNGCLPVHGRPWKANEMARAAVIIAGPNTTVDTKGGNPKGVRCVRSIDFAQYLRTHFVPQDFVVVKMDIEGAEYSVIPHLERSGVLGLIDELYLECHFRECCGPNFAQFVLGDCITLLHRLRGLGVYVHHWLT